MKIMVKDKLDVIIKEKIALKVSAVNECDLCYISHKKKLEMLGCTVETEREKAVLQFAELEL